MHPTVRKPPSYRLHNPSGQAVVGLEGENHYLGKFGTEASQERHRRLIAEWLTSPSPVTGVSAGPQGGFVPTINELVLAYWDRHVVS